MNRRGGRWSEQDLVKVAGRSSGVKGTQAGARRSPPMLLVPLRRQPNSFTCGPTCISMVAAAVKAPAGDWRVEDLSDLAGTNPQTGTTEVEMARGLTAAGLKWRRGSARSLEELDSTLVRDNLVLLRTLVGGFKHWVVVEGRGAEGYSVACPAMGRTNWKPAELLANWSARDFDHFVVSSSPQSHRPASRPIEEMTLAEFTRFAKVVPVEMINAGHRMMIDQSLEFIRGAKVDPLHRLPFEYGDWVFHRVIGTGSTTSMLLSRADAPTTLCGGISRGTPVIYPRWRGLGGGAAMVLAAHNDGPWHYLNPTEFSEAGYHARARAHALALQDALECGRSVRQEVLDSNPLLRGEQLQLPLRAGASFGRGAKQSPLNAADLSEPRYRGRDQVQARSLEHRLEALRDRQRGSGPDPASVNGQLALDVPADDLPPFMK